MRDDCVSTLLTIFLFKGWNLIINIHKKLFPVPQKINILCIYDGEGNMHFSKVKILCPSYTRMNVKKIGGIDFHYPI